MAAAEPSTAESRLTSLERQVQELRTRLAVLEKMISNPAEHAVDQSTVRKKVTYDWQA